MTSDPDPDPGDDTQILEGPDPREWAAGRIGERMADIEAVLRAQALMQGGGIFSGPAHSQATGFLSTLLDQARLSLSLAILAAYGIELPEQDQAAADLFGAAGKPRAFGAGPAQPATE